MNTALPITEPGVYDLPADVYHRDPVKGGSLSSTGARMLMPPSCPAKFKHYRDHGRPDKKVFEHGRAAHAEVLGVGDPIVVIDASDWRTKAAKEAAAEARNAGCTPLLAKDAARVRAMAAALRAHPVAGPLFARAGVAEQTLVWQDEESGVWCRVMADWTPYVDTTARVLVVDYKTTDDAHPAAFARSMARYGYHQQGPFYCDGFRALGLDNGQEPQFVLVAQEKDPPYLVTVGQPDRPAMAWGRVLNRKAIDRYRECEATGLWPGYGDDIEPLSLPSWLDHQYETALDLGAYDTIGDLR